MLLPILEVSLLENLLTSKVVKAKISGQGVIGAGEGPIGAGQDL